jgi:hypothetical protein
MPGLAVAKMVPGPRKVKNSIGNKLHNKVDVGYGLIWALEPTAAFVHDSQVDLSEEGIPVLEIKAILAYLPEADL